MADDDFYGGKTSYFGGAGEYSPQTFNYKAPPTFDYSNIDFGVPGKSGFSYTPQQAMQFEPPRSNVMAGINPVSAMASMPSYPIQSAPPSAMVTNVGRTTMPISAPALSSGAVDQATGASGGADKSFLQRAEAFAKENPTLMRLLGSVGTAGIGSLLSGQAQRSAGQLQKQLSPLGKTQREEGQRLVAAAQRGELTAPQQQQLDAFKAQQAQALASRGLSGGTAEQQLMGQVEAMRQQMLQQNLQTGLQLLGIGDSYTQQAVTAGYNASRDAQALSANFYNQALRTFGGQSDQVPYVLTRASQAVPSSTPVATTPA